MAQMRFREEQLARLYPDAIAAKLHLPSCWNRDDCRRTMEVSANNLTIRFNGPEGISAGIRTDCTVPENFHRPAEGPCKIYYYEVEIVNLGENGRIGIGFGHAISHLGSMVGWEWDSLGIHADDARLYCSSTKGSKLDDYTPPFSTGDVIGCGLDFVKRECFFTSNGEYIGKLVAFRGFNWIGTKSEPFYPLITMMSRGAEVTANFGQAKFLFPIANYIEVKLFGS